MIKTKVFIEKYLINNLWILILLLMYKSIIETIYTSHVQVYYNYFGLTYNPNFLKYIFSNIGILVIAIFIPKNKEKVSTFLIFIFIIFNVIPLSSYYWLNSQSTLYFLLVIFLVIVLSTLVKLKFKSISHDLYSFNPEKILFIIFIVYLFISFYLIIKRGGIDFRTLNFNSIYQVRSETNFVGLDGYLLNWSVKVLFPFFFTYYYYKNKVGYCFSIILIQILLYLSFGNKAFIFSTGFLVMIIFLFKRREFIKHFIVILSGINILSVLIDFIFKVRLLSAAVPFRLVFVPAQIQFQYFDFFSSNEKLFYSEGLIGKLLAIKSPYNGPITKVITQHFHNFTNPDITSNTGIISEGFANAGFLGSLLSILILGVIFILVDSFSKNIPLYVVIASFSYIMFVLNDTGILTALLTGGIWLIIILLFLLNSEIKLNYRENLYD